MTSRAEEINFAVSNNGKWAIAALLLLWENQTPVERHMSYSIGSNLVGIDSVDDVFMSECVEYIECKYPLSQTQIMKLRRIMPKYSKQIARIEAHGGKFPLETKIIHPNG